jgi:adenylate cyclase
VTRPAVPDEPNRAPLPTPDDLEELLLGAATTLRAADVAALAGTDVATARRYWRALGFADVGENVAFTEFDAEALATVATLVRAGAVDEETAVRLVRALGQTMAKLAEWQVQTLTEVIERWESTGAGSGSRLVTAYGVAARVMPAYERALSLAWRRHLGAAAARYVAAGQTAHGLLTQRLTVGFADIVGFTRMSHGLDGDQLAGVVETFESRATDVIAASGARLVKTLGDEVLFVSRSAVRAVDVGVRIVESLHSEPAIPPVRVGLATGAVVRRLGDVFGDPVNVAAVLRALADPDAVVADAATAEALRAAHDNRPIEAMGTREVAGYGPVSVVRIPVPGAPPAGPAAGPAGSAGTSRNTQRR